MSKHLQEVPPKIARGDISGEFRALTMRLLEKKPEKRFKDADTFLTVLEELEDSKPSGTYVPNTPTFNHADGLPPLQGSDTLLAPVAVLSTMDTEGPTPPTGVPSELLAVVPSSKNTAQGSGRTIALVALALLAIGATAFAVAVMTRDSEKTTASRVVVEAPAIDPPEAVPAIATDAGVVEATVVEATVVNELDAQPAPAENPGRPDAAVTSTPRRSTRPRKTVPTTADLQSEVGKAGKRITALAATLGKSDIDSLRRKWLDLATALPNVDDTVESRRRFAARLRKLKNAMKKAGRNP
jgi:hypothetical protein